MTNGPFLYVRRAEKRLFYLKKDPHFRKGDKFAMPSSCTVIPAKAGISFTIKSPSQG